MVVTASFTRDSKAYKQDGTEVRAKVPRFEPGKFGSSVMVEGGTTNLIKNPCASSDLTYWVLNKNADSVASMTRVTNDGVFGSTCVECTRTTLVSPGWIVFHQMLYRYLSSPYFDTTKQYTLSFWARSVAGSNTLRVAIRDANGTNTVLNDTTVTLTSNWQRYVITFTPLISGNQPVLYLTLTADNTTFRITAVQLEQKPYPTSFIDGTRSAETLTILTAGVLNPQEGTVECWVLWQDFAQKNDYQFIFVTRTNTTTTNNENRISLQRQINSNTILARISNASQQMTDLTYVLTNFGWVYLAITWNTAYFRLYVNGVKVAEATNPYLPSTLSPEAYIGYLKAPQGNVFQFNSLIDDLRISSRARTDEEIAAGYNSNAPLPVDADTTCKLDFDGSLRYKTTDFQVLHNTPSTGYIAWKNVDIRYKDISYNIPDGNTNKRFVWWDYDDPYSLWITDVFPADMAGDDLLLFLNKNGTAVIVPTSTILHGDLIVPGSILTDHLSANCVTAEKILAGTVQSQHIAAAAIGAAAIAAGAVLTDHLGAGVVVADKICAGAVTTAKLAAGAVTANEIAVGELSAISANLGNVTAGTIAADVVVGGMLLGTAPEVALYVGTQRDFLIGVGTTESSLADFNYAIQFTTTGTTEIARVELELDRDGLGADLVMEVRSGLLADGSNDGTLLTTIKVPKEHIPDPKAYWSIPVNVRGLTAGTQYWLVVRRAGDAVNKVDLVGEASTNANYPVYRRAGDSGAWTTGQNAIHFRTYSGRTGKLMHVLYDGGGHETYAWGVPGVFLRTYYWLPPSVGIVGGIRDIEDTLFDNNRYDRTVRN